MTEPAVSVIVLGWNGREYVDACLSSLLAQEFDRPYEIIFVDNGSADGTADAAERYEGVRVHRLDRNYGYCLGNNKGFELAKGKLVVFLNQDVVVHRRWLRELVAAVESDAAIKAGHANIIQSWYPEYAAKDPEGPPRTAYTAELSPLGFVEYRKVPVEEQVVDTLFLHGVSIILRRDVVPEIGGYVFDPDMFAYAEDMDLGLRVRNAGYRTVVATQAVLYHAHSLKTEMSLRTFIRTARIIRNRLLAFWKCASWPEFLPLAAITLVCAPFNAGQFGLSPLKRVLYFLLLIPPTVAAGFATLVAMPRFAARRRQTLAARRLPRGWLLRTFLFDRASLRRDALSAPGERRA